MRPTIVQIVPRDGIGGVEVAARSMAARDDLPCAFRLVLLAGAPLEPDAPRIVGARAGSALSPRGIWNGVRTVLRLRPDVLVCSLWRSVPVALAVKALRPRTRLVAFLHVERSVHRPDDLATRALLGASDAIWCDSAATLTTRYPRLYRRSEIVSFVAERLRPVTDPAGRAGPRFAMWCRLTQQKGIDRAITLIAELRKQGVAATLDIWGPDGGARSDLIDQVLDAGLEQAVIFHGAVPHDRLFEAAAGATFFLHLSRFEGMAIAVVEAMQLGLIPVTTDAGQMGGYVRDGDTGILVDPGTIPAAAARLAVLIRDPAALARLRTAAIDYWSDAPLYADDVCRHAIALLTD